MPSRAPRTKRRAPPKRKSASKRLYGRRWQRWSKAGLVDEPLCKTCGAEATVRDHVTPHRGNEQLFWDPQNIQSLCKPCHDRKTLIEKQ